MFRRRITREIVGALAFKAVLLSVLYWAFFAPAHRPRNDAAATGAAVFAVPGGGGPVRARDGAGADP